MSGEANKIWPLLPYQAKWVADSSPVKVAEKSRRIGISWTEAYDSVLHAAAGGGDISYISYAREMTAGFVADCADWARRLHDVAADISLSQDILRDGDRDILTYSITFASGKKITALSSAPRSLRSRGRPGDRVIIDEAAFVDDVETLLQSAMAVLIWGGTVRIISTHNGEGNAFNRLVRDIHGGRLNYSLHTIPLSKALQDGLYKRILAVRRKAAPTEQRAALAWSQDAEDKWEEEVRATYRYPWQAAEELDCTPAAGGGAWIGADHYHACEDAAAGDPDNYGGGVTWLGYDVARRKDLAVMVAIEKVGDVLWLREMVVMQDTNFGVQLDELARLAQVYRPVRIVIDQTGMGEMVVETAQRRLGRNRVVGVQLTSDKRLGVAISLRETMEDRRLRLPMDDALRADIRSVRRAEGVTSDRPRLISTGAETDGHADRFWALALAVSAAAEGVTEYACLEVPAWGTMAGGEQRDPHRPFYGRGSGMRSMRGGAWA